VYGLQGTIIAGNAEQLDTLLPATKQYDLVYSFGVIHHTPNPKAVIEQATRFVKPGGQLRLMLYSLVSYKAFQVMHETNRWTISNMRELIEEYSEAQTGSPCTYVYTFDEVEQLLHPHFKIKRILCSPNEDFGRSNKRCNADFRSTFQWFVAQIEYSRP
jgi:ubiquinone/menaquinone biosynthesis C-methylase UbiE